MKVKELIEILNQFSDEEQELEVSIGHGAGLWIATVRNVYVHDLTLYVDEERRIKEGLPEKVVEIDHDAM